MSIYLHEFFVSLFTAWIGLGMILEDKLPVGFFDVIEGGLAADSKDFVGVVQRIGEMLIEKLLLIFVEDSFLIEEPIKG